MILLTTVTLIPLIKKHILNADKNPSIPDHIWSNQLYDTFNGILLVDMTDHYPIFTFAPLNCPQKRTRVKFRDHSGQNLARLKLEVEHCLINHVQINQDVSSNTNNFCNNQFVFSSNCCLTKKKYIYISQDFANQGFLTLLWYR